MKSFAIVSALALSLALTACGKKEEVVEAAPAETATTEAAPAEATVAVEAAPADATVAAEAAPAADSK